MVVMSPHPPSYFKRKIKTTEHWDQLHPEGIPSSPWSCENLARLGNTSTMARRLHVKSWAGWQLGTPTCAEEFGQPTLELRPLIVNYSFACNEGKRCERSSRGNDWRPYAPPCAPVSESQGRLTPDQPPSGATRAAGLGINARMET